MPLLATSQRIWMRSGRTSSGGAPSNSALSAASSAASGTWTRHAHRASARYSPASAAPAPGASATSRPSAFLIAATRLSARASLSPAFPSRVIGCAVSSPGLRTRRDIVQVSPFKSKFPSTRQAPRSTGLASGESECSKFSDQAWRRSSTTNSGTAASLLSSSSVRSRSKRSDSGVPKSARRLSTEIGRAFEGVSSSLGASFSMRCASAFASC